MRPSYFHTMHSFLCIIYIYGEKIGLINKLSLSDVPTYTENKTKNNKALHI